MTRYWLLASAAVCFLAGCQPETDVAGRFPPSGVFLHEVSAGTVFAASAAEVRCGSVASLPRER